MQPDAVKKLFYSFRNHPLATIICVIVVFLLFVLGAYLTGFFGEKGRQDAMLTEISPSDPPIIIESERSEKRKGGVPGKKERKKSPPINLLALFKGDFSKYLSIDLNNVNWHIIPVAKDSAKPFSVKIHFRLHCDFESTSSFLSVYLPPSAGQHISTICKGIPDKLDEIMILIKKDLKIGGTYHGERVTELADLVFTRRIYIYHDSYLSPKEKDRLRMYYGASKLDPRFRGFDYLLSRKKNEKGTFTDSESK